MKYIKIRADFKYAKRGRFFRTVLVREDATMEELGEFLIEMFGGTFEHMFLFIKEKERIEYVHPSWLKEDSFGFYKQYSYRDRPFTELGDSFVLCYDTGDGWDFKCKVYRTTKDIPFDDEEDICFGFVLNGAGMGIWEDNIRSLMAYLDGEIPEDFSGEDEENCIYKPWNFDIEKYSEFDNPIDIEDLNEMAKSFVPMLKIMEDDDEIM